MMLKKKRKRRKRERREGYLNIIDEGIKMGATKASIALLNLEELNFEIDPLATEVT